MTYIEVFKGENPDAVFMERLQHVTELHRQRKSSASIRSDSLEWEIARLEEEEEEDAEKRSNQSTPRHKLSRQSRINSEEGIYEEEEQNIEIKDDQTMSDEVGAHNFNSNNNSSSLTVGERIVVYHQDCYMSGHVRYIGEVSTIDKEQIGVELDQPYGERLCLYKNQSMYRSHLQIWLFYSFKIC